MERNLKGLVYSTLAVGASIRCSWMGDHANRKHCAMTTEVAASSHVTGDIQSRKGGYSKRTEALGRSGAQ